MLFFMASGANTQKNKLKEIYSKDTKIGSRKRDKILSWSGTDLPAPSLSHGGSKAAGKSVLAQRRLRTIHLPGREKGFPVGPQSPSPP